MMYIITKVVSFIVTVFIILVIAAILGACQKVKDEIDSKRLKKDREEQSKRLGFDVTNIYK